ncbi:MAG: 5'-nucleotidase C-terminal domain-containing protein [Oscillatoriophycideae cyanobacterium NC_groundwater_1537_Pr4_S-0.65um_50_18]|nr:5'-nucleotidase C-terminal domain-containing protein [Oscillatoriophycideae cyanobacterium NC_groundwater_1537_Pr4_S-0.65um_50_18]
MPTTLQILHASDFEGGIAALEDAVGFSAVLNYFKTSSTGQYGVSSTVLANTITLSSGDNSIPGPFLYGSSDPALNGIGGLGTSSSPLIGRGDVAILNEFGIQASAVGNHDLDLGVSQFGAALRSGGGSPGSSFPYISSNLDYAPEVALGNLRSTDLATNQATAEASSIRGKLAESTVITVAGNDGVTGTADDQKIGVVGATTPTLRQITASGQIGVLPANPTDYDALAAEIQKSVDALAATGINKIVLVAHMQQIAIERDELARRLRDVDVIIAGGSNTLLSDANDTLRSGDTRDGDYPIVKTSATGQPILVVNTDGNYKYVGRLVLPFDDNGIIDTNSLNSTLNGAFATDEAGVDRVYGSDVNPRERANPNVVAITDGLRDVISQKDNLITGKTTFFLNGDRGSVRTEETNLGNLTADANLAYGKQIDPTVVISLKNGGGIRDNIGVVSAASGATDNSAVDRLPPQPNPLAPNKTTGSVSQLDIENSLRFNNALSLITVTAAQLKELLENGVSGVRAGATPGAFPQVSGLKFSFDATQPAQVLAADGSVTTTGQRIRSLVVVNDNDKIVDVLVENGAVVGNPSRSFRMVTLNFLAGTTTTAGGDGYPFFRFINENPTLANRVDLTGETTTDLNGNGRIDPAVAIAAGGFTFATAGTEQDALAEYLSQVGTYSEEDTAAAQDTRIQNISLRSDAILSGGRQVNGTNRNDRLRGNVGDDVLVGLSGNDRLFGLSGNDEMDGNLGNDILQGDAGNDLLRGGSGTDRMLGGNGNDTLLGGAGSDVFSLGRGRDIAVLETGRGANFVTDFADRQDRLALSGRLTFGRLTIEQSGRNTAISLGNDLLMMLRNFNANNLTRADFVSLD